LDDVAEAHRDLYIEDEENGVFRLDVEPTSAEQAFAAGLKNSRDTLLKEKKKIEKELKGRMTAEERQALETERDELREKLAGKEKDPNGEDMVSKAEIERVRLLTIEEKDKEVLTEREEKLGAVAEVERLLVENAGVLACQAEKGSARLLMPEIRANTKIVRNDDGTYRAEVLDAQGHPRINVSDGSPFTILQLVQELKKDADFSGAFTGSGSSGSGAGDTKRSGGAGHGKKVADMTVSEKTAFIQEHGGEAWSEKVYAESQP
jgi:hypothetical protein